MSLEPPASALESTCKLASAAAPHDCVRRLIPLPAGEPIALRRDIITIGRTKENDVCIPSHAVSRALARLLLGPRSVTLVDMDSANGCFVNEVRVKKQRLRHGDVLTIGDRSYRFAAADADADGLSRLPGRRAADRSRPSIFCA